MNIVAAAGHGGYAEGVGTLRAHGGDRGGAAKHSSSTGGCFDDATFNATDYASGAFEQDECSSPITTSPDRSRAAPIVASGLPHTHTHTPNLSFALTAKGGRFDGESETFVCHSLRGEGFDASEDGTGRGTPLVPVQGFIERGRDGGTAMELEADGITAAITTGTQRQQGVVGSFGVRRLLPIETERCQGMPDHFTRYGVTEDGKRVELSDSARYRLVGNSVAVPNVTWIAKRIIECDLGSHWFLPKADGRAGD